MLKLDGESSVTNHLCVLPQAAAPPAEELLQCHRLWVGLPRLGIPGRPAGIPAVPEPEAAAAGSDGPWLQASTHRFVKGNIPVL